MRGIARSFLVGLLVTSLHLPLAHGGTSDISRPEASGLWGGGVVEDPAPEGGEVSEDAEVREPGATTWRPGDPVPWESDAERESPGIDTTPVEVIEVRPGWTLSDHVGPQTWRIEPMLAFQRARNVDLMARHGGDWDPNRTHAGDVIYVPSREWIGDWYRKQRTR